MIILVFSRSFSIINKGSGNISEPFHFQILRFAQDDRSALQSFDKLRTALCSGTGWVAINRQGLILGGRPCLGNVALAVLGSRLVRQGRKAIFRPCPTLRSGSEHLLVLNRGGLVGVDDHGADLNGMGLVGVLDLE